MMMMVIRVIMMTIRVMTWIRRMVIMTTVIRILMKTMRKTRTTVIAMIVIIATTTVIPAIPRTPQTTPLPPSDASSASDSSSTSSPPRDVSPTTPRNSSTLSSSLPTLPSRGSISFPPSHSQHAPLPEKGPLLAPQTCRHEGICRLFHSASLLPTGGNRPETRHLRRAQRSRQDRAFHRRAPAANQIHLPHRPFSRLFFT